MKLGILTFFNYNNYGAALQCYGLYKTLANMGHEVEYLDYTCPYIGNPFKLIHLKNKGIFGYIYSTVGYICYLPRRKKFNEFRLLIPHTEPLNQKNIDSVGERYDKYITGSDQVWSAKLTDFDKAYFLKFVKEDNKKYSYAASFGENTVQEENKELYAKLLGKFEGISVREDYGQELVQNLSGKESEVTVDPTLLLNEKEWIEICSKKRVKGKYILVYQLGFSKQLIQAVKEVQRLTGLQVIYVPFPLGGALKCKISLSIGPAEWLSLFRHADYVITDSYHGIIFSLIFKRLFLGVVDGQHKNKRAISLLTKLHLESRIAKDDQFEEIQRPIDYSKVMPILEEEAEKSREWLRKNIGVNNG